MRRPDFFLVGAPKSGTSAMTYYLRQHPEIFIPAEKDMIFFGSDLGYRHPRFSSLKDYCSLFAAATSKKLVGDSCVWYLSSKEAAREIKEFSPEARIIIMLRNPIDMLYSLHSQALYDRVEVIRDFQEALNAEAERAEGRRLPTGVTFTHYLRYREVAKYSVHVARYFEVFGRDRVYVIIFDDFVANTAGTYADTLRFLGVDPLFTLPSFPVVNPNKEKRISSSFGSRLAARMPALVGDMLRHLNTRYGSRAPMDPEVRRRLAREMHREIVDLGNLIGRDLTHWCELC